MLCSIICRQNKKLLDIFHNLTFRSFYESLFLSRCHNLKRNQAIKGANIFLYMYIIINFPIVNNLTDNLEHNGHRVMSSVILPEHQYFSIFRFLVVSNRNEHVISAVLYIRRIHSVKLFPVQHYRIRWVGKINHIQPFFAFKEKINFQWAWIISSFYKTSESHRVGLTYAEKWVLGARSRPKFLLFHNNTIKEILGLMKT